MRPPGRRRPRRSRKEKRRRARSCARAFLSSFVRVESDSDAGRLRSPPPSQPVLPARRREQAAGALQARGRARTCRPWPSPTTATCSGRSTFSTRPCSTGSGRSSASRRTSPPRDRQNREAQAASESGEGYAYHLTLLGATQKGYQNLVRLVSEAYLSGFYHRPRMDKELLREHAEGLIGLSGCLKGEVAGALSRGQLRRREKGLPRVPGHLRKGKLLRRDHGPRPAAADRDRARPAAALDRDRRAGGRHQRQPLPAPRRRLPARGPALHRDGQDARGRAPHAFLQRRVLRQGPGRDEGAVRVLERRGGDEHRGDRRALRQCRSTPTACTCRRFTAPDGRPPAEYFATSRARGSSAASTELSSATRPRSTAREVPASGSTYEMAVIEKMGFPSYFLIVWDFIRYAREKGIPVGPGRGSAAGLDRLLGPADHGDRSAQVRPPLRAVPEPRAHLDARHRHRLLPGAPGRGHRVRHGTSTAARTSRRSSRSRS